MVDQQELYQSSLPVYSPKDLYGQRKWIGCYLFFVMIAALAIGLAPAPVWAQQEASASIVGHVTDQSGAVVPNVTITATSPALQVPQVTTTSDANGDYKLLNLPAPGDYRVQFELQGFGTVVQDNVRLGVGFAGRVDASLKVGATTQSVQVTGVTPVVDTVNTTGSNTLQEQEIVNTPKGTTLQELLPLAQGVSMSGRPDVGDSNLAQRQSLVTYGLVLEPTLNLEGINITTSHDEDTAVYFDSFSLGEVEFNSSGNNADVSYPGVEMVAQFKSGSNAFHGDAEYDFENKSFQSSNVSPALAAEGVTTTNPLASSGFYDYMGDYGGRIIRDKLWFYGESSREVQDSGSFGFKSGPDAAGCWTCVDAPLAFIGTHLTTVMGKGDYQIKPTIKLIGAYQYALKFLSAQGSGATTMLSAVEYQTQPGSLWKGETQWTPNSHLFVDALAGFGGYHVHYVTVPASAMQTYGNYPSSAPNTDIPGDPSEENLAANSLVSGTLSGPNDRPELRVEARGSVSYITGHHQFKFGTEINWEEAHTAVLGNNNAGDYELIFNGAPAGCNAACGTLANGSEIELFNYPVLPQNWIHSQALFAIDTWALKRVVLNYGVRWERYNSYYLKETKPVGQFSTLFPSATYPGVDVLDWKDVTPRVGAAWDVKGNGKTVVKGSFGIFRDTMGDLFANQMNPNTISDETFNWTGSCYNPGTTNEFYYDEFHCDVNPAFLATLNSATPPTAVATGGAVFQLNNPNLTQPMFYEYTARVQRQLAANIALNVGFLQHRAYNLYNAADSPGSDLASLADVTTFNGNGMNVGHPYSSYTIPVTYNNTGLGSQYLPATKTLYTYPKGSGTLTCGGVVGSCTEYLNNPSSRPDVFNTLEVSVTKRYSKQFNALGSFWITKNHRWINGLEGIQGDPDDDFFPTDNTWNWEARADVTYNAPKSFKVYTYLRMNSGYYGQEVAKYSGTGTNGNAVNQGAITTRVGPFGQFQGPTVPVWSMEVSRVFQFHERYQIEPDFELFNITNSDAATSTSYTVGPTFNEVTGILAPRIFRLGVKGRF